MFDHVSIGVSDLKRAGRFYDAVLKPLDCTRLVDGEGALGYGETGAGLWLLPANKPVKAEIESGLHFCFQAKSRAAVDAFYAAALKEGGKDNGKPGVRPHYHPNYYGAFVLDPDGHNIEAVCHAPA
jgi:catechol 2,3-dioxygenase-like lactoylglutathione lyase family enzyme